MALLKLDSKQETIFRSKAYFEIDNLRGLINFVEKEIIVDKVENAVIAILRIIITNLVI